MGEEIKISVTPDVKPEDRQTNEPVNAKRGEVFRPFLHFTPDYGWHNDPNGLLEYTSPVTGKTVWHMFYQYNPYDWVWGNMHWGHAISDDLLHWKQLPIALFPDADGTMFSGSAIVDRENRSGLKTGDEDVILLFYTAAGNTSALSEGKAFTQCLAYSNDGGMTFTKYANNPVVGHIRADNRDPKVIWCAELGKYLMAIYLDGNEYALLTSENFLEWEELQRLTIDGDAECPDIYPLNANGDPAKRKWVLSGASHRYLVGEFESGKFRPVQSARRLSYGSSSYAAQTFSVYGDRRRIQIAWDRDMNFGSATFMGQMGIPCELTLKEDAGGYTLRAEPVAELESLTADVKHYENIDLTTGEAFNVTLEESAYELSLNFDPAAVKGSLRIDLFGQTILLDVPQNAVKIGADSMPIRMPHAKPELRFLLDKGSAEVFGSGGIMTVPWMLNFNQRQAVFTFEGEGSAKIGSMTLKKLTL